MHMYNPVRKHAITRRLRPPQQQQAGRSVGLSPCVYLPSCLSATTSSPVSVCKGTETQPSHVWRRGQVGGRMPRGELEWRAGWTTTRAEKVSCHFLVFRRIRVNSREKSKEIFFYFYFHFYFFHYPFISNTLARQLYLGICFFLLLPCPVLHLHRL
ncbi:hypothetical protein MAPG_05843 [Magnaporthiopsis poae ATCC 64411]|uniref:Uncharacterized protein n=1 Tax=Magnaporthiopsis poae (strain ATCC 64411 / 73-15) TaxID=644358 RepID=A0A0C4E0H0_MAGP6|nr:hypothetical protein MAPG_05843 [Magnaporthiopsis poae ATCC 64411]